jgi:hypothetical protein
MSRSPSNTGIDHLAMNTAHEAPLSQLHRQDHVLGRSLTVWPGDHDMVRIRPHLVRLLPSLPLPPVTQATTTSHSQEHSHQQPSQNITATRRRNSAPSHACCCRICLYGVFQGAAYDGAPDSCRTHRALRPIHDTARGPSGPCSVAARPQGHLPTGRDVSPPTPRSARGATRGTSVPLFRVDGPLGFSVSSAAGTRDRSLLLVGMRAPDGCRCAMAHAPPWTSAEPTQRLAGCDGTGENRASPARVESNPHCRSPGQPQAATATPDHTGVAPPAMTHRSSPTHARRRRTEKSPPSGGMPDNRVQLPR